MVRRGDGAYKRIFDIHVFFFYVQLLKARVADQKPEFDTVSKQAQDLIAAGLGFDSALVKQMSDTDKQWHDVNDMAANQQVEIEKALQKVEEMQKALDKADQAMSETEDKIKQLAPIGSDVDTINQQLEDIKVSEDKNFIEFETRR